MTATGAVGAGAEAPLDLPPAPESLAADVLAGLRARPKRLQPLFFYDALGSWLFERICEQPEYYLTRSELQILEQHGTDIGARIGPDARIVELGSGSARKSRLLLAGLTRPAAYVPIDISRSALVTTADEIAAACPQLAVQPVCADFTRPLRLPRAARGSGRTVAFFPGSTLGNFEHYAAVDLLATIRELVGAGASLLIGTDLVKDASTLEAAYDDAAGVTREFNLNVLRRLNREFDANFELSAFRHEAHWDGGASRIEMRLVSRLAQRVTIAGQLVEFARGEALITEFSHKYTKSGFLRLAAAGGWRHVATWTDDRQRFAVHLLDAERRMLDSEV